jgi:hypothetical protein
MESSGSSRDLIRFQLSVLELYEGLLQGPILDESKVNAALKTFLASALSLMQLQRSLGEQITTVQLEMIRQYRAQLEQWLAENGDSTR